MSVTLITSHGEIKIEIFCELVPYTAKNFLALAASDAFELFDFLVLAELDALLIVFGVLIEILRYREIDMFIPTALA